MDGLPAVLLAAIEETERLAREAGGDRWYQDGKTGEIIATNGKTAENCGGGYWTGIAEHIAHNDPSSVLRRCAADRRTVEEWLKQAESPLNGLSDEPPYFIVNLAKGYGLSDHQEGEE